MILIWLFRFNFDLSGGAMHWRFIGSNDFNLAVHGIDADASGAGRRRCWADARRRQRRVMLQLMVTRVVVGGGVASIRAVIALRRRRRRRRLVVSERLQRLQRRCRRHHNVAVHAVQGALCRYQNLLTSFIQSNSSNQNYDSSKLCKIPCGNAKFWEYSVKLARSAI